MVQRVQCSRVVITDHALQRWQQYGGRGKLTPERVRRRLLGEMRAGKRFSAGAVFVSLGRLVAVLCPREDGGWSVVTVHNRRKWKLRLKMMRNRQRRSRRKWKRMVRPAGEADRRAG